jgi:hypothetical protein
LAFFAVGYEDERLFTEMGEMDRANCVCGGVSVKVNDELGHFFQIGFEAG